MNQTANYNLKKPEPTDPLRVADFNENADRIDAALGACTKIVTGSYVGNGDYGVSDEKYCTYIPFTGSPKFIIVGGASYYMLFLMPNLTAGMGISGLPNPVNTVAVTWREDRVFWYSTSGAAQQMNQTNHTYYYMIFY